MGDSLFKKITYGVAITIVFGLPAIYWAGTTLLGIDVKASIERTYQRMFSIGGNPAPTLDDLPDDGGD